MKRFACAGLLAFGAVMSAMAAYDCSPNKDIVIPECIWAAATGGGTWVTEVQVIACSGDSGSTTVEALFYYGTGSRSVTLGIFQHFHSLKYTNILSTMQSLDPTFNYYGRVGALM